jgi:hypothetical protein
MGFPFNQNGITFKALFGLLKKSLPFRLVYTPPIPGTDLEIFFWKWIARRGLNS